jgi:hypothetical protein
MEEVLGRMHSLKDFNVHNPGTIGQTYNPQGLNIR